jgi:uncharacterized protein
MTLMQEVKYTEKRQWFEIAAVLATGVMKYVFMDWLELRVFYIVIACLFWITFIFYRYRNNKLILKEWGFRKRNFKKAFLFLTPFALAVIVGIFWYGFIINATFLNWHLLPIIFFYPAWGIIQQFLVLSIVAGNLHAIPSVKLNKIQIILLVSVVFSLVHYPVFPLFVFTFFMEFLFALAFFKWRNLWPLGLYHGWVASLLLFFVLDRNLWNELWVIF